MRKAIVFFSLVALAIAPGLWAQQGGGGGAGAGGGGGGGQQGGGGAAGGGGGRGGGGQQGGGGGQQGGLPGLGNTQNTNTQTQQERPVYFSGKVMLEDGSPPPAQVTIVRVCNGQNHPEGYTDSKGNFSFQIGGNPSVAMADASVSSVALGGPPGMANRSPGFGGQFNTVQNSSARLGVVNLNGCELRAELAGFRADAVALGQRSVFDNPDIGVIILRRIAGVQGTSVSAADLAAPKNAKKAFDNGVKEMGKNKPNAEKALKQFDKAVAEYPKYASAWSAIGQIRMAQNDNAAAREAFEKALAADPKYIFPYGPLVQLHLIDGNWEDAITLSSKALELNPYLTDVRYMNAVACYNAEEFDQSEKALLEIQQGNEADRFPQTDHLLGLIHGKRGDFDKAAGHYRAFLSAVSEGPAAEDAKRKLNEWEALGVIAKAPAAPAGAVTAVKE